MTIIEKTYDWAGKLSQRKSTEYIVIHHSASSKCSADDIHRSHLSNGWTGIGYHYFVRKDGTIYTARPIDTIGAHTTSFNSKSIGVCFEGNFEHETASEKQIDAGCSLIEFLKQKYPGISIKKHRDFNSTACPGKNFPWKEVTESKKAFSSVEDIVTALEKRNIMTNTELWRNKCTSDSNAYHLAKKIANMTQNHERKSKLETVNDIVWELGERGIITDKHLWLKLMNEDKNLYWLGFKTANMTEMKPQLSRGV